MIDTFLLLYIPNYIHVITYHRYTHKRTRHGAGAAPPPAPKNFTNGHFRAKGQFGQNNLNFGKQWRKYSGKRPHPPLTKLVPYAYAYTYCIFLWQNLISAYIQFEFTLFEFRIGKRKKKCVVKIHIDPLVQNAWYNFCFTLKKIIMTFTFLKNYSKLTSYAPG